MCSVATVRGTRDSVARKVLNQYKYCSFFVLSKEEKLVREILCWKPLDIVRVTGFIETKDMNKEIPCPNCRTVNQKSSAIHKERAGEDIIYVHPVYVKRTASYDDQQMAHLDVIKNAEISNRVFLRGSVIRNPERHELVDKVYTRYQLFVTQEYLPEGAEEPTEILAFPWVYSYGENAEKDFMVLQPGASVLIDGAIQNRRYKNKYICTNCGEMFEVQGKTLEIISYATEYLACCKNEALASY